VLVLKLVDTISNDVQLQKIFINKGFFIEKKINNNNNNDNNRNPGMSRVTCKIYSKCVRVTITNRL